MEAWIVRRGAVISGVVQAVGYRYSACLAARRLGVAGFVRNRSDGAVELEVEGSPEAVDAMLDWAATGPAGARVASVKTAEREPIGSRGFDIRE